jgi:hypothetical protein
MAFTLHIFASEFKEIEEFVSKYPNIETGGDLFGLWKANGDPVVQLLIGPGQNCRRTSVSFHQDTNYLARVGTYVNTSFMLCHIGSWHSHHQLSLTQPSAGDRSTVCNNFPEGLKRYIMIIANITRGMSGRQSVTIHPYMFTDGGHVCRLGNVKIISLESPFRELGFVLDRIGQGAEQRVSAEASYPSRAPAEYHNRPSTRSKPITGTRGRISSESQSNAPKNPLKQNYFSNSANSPMDGDSSYKENSYQHKTSPTRNVLSKDMNGVTQWYETEKGGTLLKSIVDEITATMTSDIDYHRHANSKDLTMEFTHYGKRWTINFPKSFDSEPAQIRSSSSGKNIPSKSITSDIRKACRCSQCRNNEHINKHQHLPSIKNHPSPPKQDNSHYHAKQRPPSPRRSSPPPQNSYPRQGRHSPQHKRPQSKGGLTSSRQPWFDTHRGKATVDEIKESIERHSNAGTNVGRVRVMETLNSQGKGKRLLFYHNRQDWIIELVSTKEDGELKTEEHGQKKFVAKLKAPNYDVVGALTRHCVCAKCRSLRSRPSSVQRRPESTRSYSRHAVNDEPRPRSRLSSPPKFFSTEEGERKFKKIHTDITNVLLDGGNVDMSRNTFTKDVDVTFKHYRRQWKVTFPFTFPKLPPKLQYFSHSFSVPRGDVIRAVRKECPCSSCKRYR